MNQAKRVLLVGVVGFVGAAIAFAMTVYPFQYGLIESVALAAAFVLFALFETVLQETSF